MAPEKKEEATTQTIASDEVVVKRSTLEGVLARIDELEKTTRKTTIATPKIANERVVTVAFHNGLPVVELGQFSKTYNEVGDETVWIDIILLDGDKRVVQKVNYVEFLRDTERRTGRIIGKNVVPITTIQKDPAGNPLSVEKQYVKEYGTYGTGKEVEIIVESSEQIFNLEFEDGLKITIADKFVNI